MFVYYSLWKSWLSWFFRSALNSANKPYCLPFEAIVWIRWKWAGLAWKLHYALFKALEMTRLAPYLKCLRYSVKYWLLLKICLLLPRHVNIWCGWTTSSYAFKALRFKTYLKQSNQAGVDHVLQKNICVCQNLFYNISWNDLSYLK